MLDVPGAEVLYAVVMNANCKMLIVCHPIPTAGGGDIIRLWLNWGSDTPQFFTEMFGRQKQSECPSTDQGPFEK